MLLPQTVQSSLDEKTRRLGFKLTFYFVHFCVQAEHCRQSLLESCNRPHYTFASFLESSLEHSSRRPLYCTLFFDSMTRTLPVGFGAITQDNVEQVGAACSLVAWVFPVQYHPSIFRTLLFLVPPVPFFLRGWII